MKEETKILIEEEEEEEESISIEDKKNECFKETITLPFRIIFSFLIEIIILPIIIILLLLAWCGVSFNYDPDKNFKKKVPILLIHGNGFNEIEWLIGRYYLNKQEYGDIFSLNYDGLISNDNKMGICDYAKGKVRSKILEILKKTQNEEIILIGKIF
jgi:hypothetical protein